MAVSARDLKEGDVVQARSLLSDERLQADHDIIDFEGRWWVVDRLKGKLVENSIVYRLGEGSSFIKIIKRVGFGNEPRELEAEVIEDTMVTTQKEEKSEGDRLMDFFFS